MRWATAIVLFQFIYFLQAKEASRLNFRADSIYQNLSRLDRENLRVWIKSDDYNSIKEFQFIGGIYSQSEIQTPVFDKPQNIALAVQANLDFRPFPSSKKLPGLQTLSSISDPFVLHRYLEYFRSESRKYGIDFIVLPSKKENIHLSEFLSTVHNFDPGFFMDYESLSFNPDPKRKNFYPVLEYSNAIVISPDSYSGYQNTLSKGAKRFKTSKEELTAYIRQILMDPEPVKNKDQILHSIWSQSISLYEKEQLLPLRTDTVAVWVSNENTNLFTDLEQYYGTVLNVKYDEIPEKVPVILDARFNLFQAAEYAYQLQAHNPIIWISNFETLTNVNANSYLITPEISDQHDLILADMIYGGESISGRNIWSIPGFLTDYQLIKQEKQQLLSYSQPEWVGMNPLVLDSIDLIAEEMIKNFASPGGQILIARDGKIIFEKNYGFLTYDSLIQVQPYTLYDLASLTKVTSTLLCVMKLWEEKQIHLDSTISTYLPDYVETNKQDITIRKLLAHQAGLPSYIPFWKRTIDIEGLETFYYKSEADKLRDDRSYGIYPNTALKDSLYNWIKLSTVSNREKYRYSDIGFMLLQLIVEKVSGESIENYVTENFYEPMHLTRIMFNPVYRGQERQYIAPTEYDYYFRKEQVWGDVHDRNAAILGGIAGHAGLFSTSKELAIISQMLIQGGVYGGQRYLNAETIDTFNQYQFEGNRRGLGWDKPGYYNPTISKYASDVSYGHTGFTGTLVWIDPAERLTYIFLSNRIFPDSQNWALNELDIRSRIQDIIYRSLRLN